MSPLCLKPFDGFVSPSRHASSSLTHPCPTLKKKKTSLVSHHLACPLQLNSFKQRAKETQSVEVRMQNQTAK